MKENEIFISSIEEYSKYKNALNKTLHSISNFISIEYKTDLRKLGNEEELFGEFLFFLNIPKLISFDVGGIFKENFNIFNKLSKIRINSNNLTNNENIYKLLLHFHIFLLYRIEDSINLMIKKSEKLNSSNLYIQVIHQSHQILIQILLILLKIYREKKIEINKIILFFEILNLFINVKNNNNDKYLKVKSIIFLKLLIQKYFGYFLTLLLKEQETNKNDIILMFDYMLKVLNSDKLKQNFNNEILVHNGLITESISTILNIFEENKNVDIYIKYKDEMINCFANIFKSNTHEFNFFELLININKQSFINLFNYENRKKLIIKDLYSQNFCIELLYKLFNVEKDCLNNIKTDDNYFVFNGYNSKMTFHLP